MSDAMKSRRAAVIASLREDTVFATKCSSLIAKQQGMVRHLNEENLRLIDENERLRKESSEAADQIDSLNSINQDLIEQNSHLREQLATSQNFGVMVLKELKRHISKKSVIQHSTSLNTKFS